MMPSPGLPVLLVLAVLGVTVLTALHLAASRSAARERARVFDDVLGTVDEPCVACRGGGYPEMTGRVNGRQIRLRVVVDALVLRKLPVLWLEVVVSRPIPVAGSVSVLMRPHGAEFFSPNGRFRHEVRTPASFPRAARVAASVPDAAAGVPLLEPLTAFLHEPRTKEVGLGPGGARAVRLLAEADQGDYRVSRRASFTGARVSPPELLQTVEQLCAVDARCAAGEATA